MKVITLDIQRRIENIKAGREPGFWMNETSGVLRPAVLAFLNGGPMTAPDIAA